MRLVTSALLVATALLGILAGRPTGAARTLDEKAGAPAALQGGGRSVDELIAQLLQALRKKDNGALRELRMTEKEYREIIVPGSAKPGEPPPRYTSDFTDYLWGSLNTKNYYGEQILVRTYGGKALTLKGTSFIGGERQFAGYTSHRGVDLNLTDDQGTELLIEMGSIAKVGDRYKFVSFMRD